MSTLTIEDMKERILRPKRASLNAKATNPTPSAASTPAPTDGPRGQAHGAMESGSLAHPTQAPGRPGIAAALPSLQAVFGGTTPLRIPKPSEIFGVQPGFYRTPTHASLQRLPAPTGLPTIPQLPAPGQLTSASSTRLKEHNRRLRTVAKRLQRVNQKRQLEASLTPNPEFIPLHMDAYAPPPPASPGWGGILSGFRQWYTDRVPSTPPATEQDAGVHMEFDTDVVDALVYTMGRWLGLNAEQLRDSPGLRTLVSRNIEWFRSSPDWLKLTGLVLAKKLNQSLDCPARSLGHTQRMLLDRMVQPVGTGSEGEASGTEEPSAAQPEPEMSTETPNPTVPQPKKRRSNVRASSTSPSTVKAKAKSKPKATAKKATKERRMTTTKPAKRRRVVKLRSLLTVSPPEVSLDTVPMDTDTVPAPTIATEPHQHSSLSDDVSDLSD